MEEITLFVAEVEHVQGRVNVRGEVWLGPVNRGDRFTAATTATEDRPVQLDVEEIAAPPDAQEPGRVPRVVAVLSGDGEEHVRAGVVLVGQRLASS